MCRKHELEGKATPRVTQHLPKLKSEALQHSAPLNSWLHRRGRPRLTVEFALFLPVPAFHTFAFLTWGAGPNSTCARSVGSGAQRRSGRTTRGPEPQHPAGSCGACRQT